MLNFTTFVETSSCNVFLRFKIVRYSYIVMSRCEADIDTSIIITFESQIWTNIYPKNQEI